MPSPTTVNILASRSYRRSSLPRGHRPTEPARQICGDPFSTAHYRKGPNRIGFHEFKPSHPLGRRPDGPLALGNERLAVRRWNDTQHSDHPLRRFRERPSPAGKSSLSGRVSARDRAARLYTDTQRPMTLRLNQQAEQMQPSGQANRCDSQCHGGRSRSTQPSAKVSMNSHASASQGSFLSRTKIGSLG
jgi:hypothetical protein